MKRVGTLNGVPLYTDPNVPMHEVWFIPGTITFSKNAKFGSWIKPSKKKRKKPLQCLSTCYTISE